MKAPTHPSILDRFPYRLTKACGIKTSDVDNSEVLVVDDNTVIIGGFDTITGTKMDNKRLVKAVSLS